MDTKYDCPFCCEPSIVYKTKGYGDREWWAFKRVRECTVCGKRFTTTEFDTLSILNFLDITK